MFESRSGDKIRMCTRVDDVVQKWSHLESLPVLVLILNSSHQ